MSTLLRFTALAASVLSVLLAESPLHSLAASLPVLALFMYASGESPTVAVMRNIMVIGFAATFSLFVMLGEGGFTGTVAAGAMHRAIVIVLVYNLAWSGFRRMGSAGFTAIAGMVPSERVRIYLLLLYAMTARLVRNGVNISRLLKLRFPMTAGNRLIIARYYFSNLIMKELYSVHRLQAVAVTRLAVPPVVYCVPSPSAPADVAAAAYAAASLAVIAGGLIP